MASWQYRCVCCGVLREAPFRPGGAVYLRCTATGQWAWYEPSSFLAPAAAGAGAPRAQSRTRAAVQAPSAARRRTPARGSRRPAARKASRPARKRR
jgi:hypothetical protein